jgi:hypothetical protein
MNTELTEMDWERYRIEQAEVNAVNQFLCAESERTEHECALMRATLELTERALR